MMTNKNNTSEINEINRRYVVAVAKHYVNEGLTLQQLIEEGNKGLEEAAKRFDETAGYKFMSYAVWWIRQSILQALREAQKHGVRPQGDTLTEREREILRSIDEGVSLSDIASRWSLPQWRLLQIRDRAQRKRERQTNNR